MTDLILRASRFATNAHAGQVRKYTGEPYINHCKEVATILLTAGESAPVIAAGWLHDVIEDCAVGPVELVEAFGEQVARLVLEVTDVSKPEDGNRAARKALDRAHLAKASPDGQTIKLADIISNTRSIVQHDPAFAKVYLQEKRELLAVMEWGSPLLTRKAQEMVEGGLG